MKDLSAGTIEQFTRKNIEDISRIERERKAMQPLASRMASSVAAFCSRGTILVIHALFFAVWVAYNSSPLAFDPYPFTFLTLVVSLEAIFLSFFIMIGQSASRQESERRHHLDLQINLLNEREMTAMLRLLGKVAERLDIHEKDQAEIKKFAYNTDPRTVLEQIVTAEEVAAPCASESAESAEKAVTR